MSVQPKRRRFTIDDVRRMIAAEIVQDDERIELINGEIIELAALGGEHVECVFLCNHQLSTIPGATWYVSVLSAIQLADDRAPQPDLALIRRRAYRGELPKPADIFLVVEVADTTLRHDRDVKLPLYAEAGNPEAWIIDVKRRRITRYSDPQRDAYVPLQTFHLADTIDSLILPVIRFPVGAIFPRLTRATHQPHNLATQ